MEDTILLVATVLKSEEGEDSINSNNNKIGRVRDNAEKKKDKEENVERTVQVHPQMIKAALLKTRIAQVRVAQGLRVRINRNLQTERII